MAFRVERSAYGGARLVAARDLTAGEMVLDEEPLAEGAASQHDWCRGEALWALLYDVLSDLKGPKGRPFLQDATYLNGRRLAGRPLPWTASDEAAARHMTDVLFPCFPRATLNTFYLCLFTYNIAYRHPETGERWHAFYPQLSFANHSCAPTCRFEKEDHARRKRLVTLRAMKEGEELTFNYAYCAFGDLPVAERRAYLRQHYSFQCLCERCRREEPGPEMGASWCAACGVMRSGLRQCARCKKARYCDADCQKVHWKNGHREACTA